MDIESISLGELDAELDRGDDLRLFMTMSEWTSDAAHISGSFNIYSLEDGAR